jgi:hypothetical protein
LFCVLQTKMGSIVESPDEWIDWSGVYNAISLRPLLNEFIEWITQALGLVVDRILVPLTETIKNQTAPVVDYISNQTHWFVPVAVIGWYGPGVLLSAILVGLQCIFAVLMICGKVKELCGR